MLSLEELLQLKVLEHKNRGALRGRRGEEALETLEGQGKVKLVQMCAKVDPELYTRLDEITRYFEMSKREFIEHAVGEAVQMAEAKLDEIVRIEQERRAAYEAESKEGA